MTRWAVFAFVVVAAGCPKREESGSSAPREDRAAPPTSPVTAVPAPSAAASSESGASHLAAFSERIGERESLVRKLERDGIDDEQILRVLRRVPRHAFVPASVRDMAYRDRPLPIGNGQTISQPFIVAAMTKAVRPAAPDKCLEIGTGSGYQAAILAELCKKTYSIEYIPELAENAKTTLRSLGYGPDRVELRTGDGYRGWPDAAPFDVIVVTAAPERVPQPLLDQLAVGGRLVAPIGSAHGVQRLELWTRIARADAGSALEKKTLMDVRFVPFLGDAGSK